MVLRRYNGTYPTTFIESGLQWDAPNAWPPHQYIALQALLALPSNVSSGAIPQPPSGQSAYALVPSGQLDVSENALPGQFVANGKNSSSTGSSADINALNGTFVNGGNATAGEGWRDALARGLANRYFTSAFCSWSVYSFFLCKVSNDPWGIFARYSTGGSIPNILPRLTDQQLNVSQSTNNTGNVRGHHTAFNFPSTNQCQIVISADVRKVLDQRYRHRWARRRIYRAGGLWVDEWRCVVGCEHLRWRTCRPDVP